MLSRTITVSGSGGFAALMCGEPLAHRGDILFYGYAAIGDVAASEKESATGKAKPFRTSKRQSRKIKTGMSSPAVSQVTELQNG